MSKRMLIDARQSEETRVVITSTHDGRLLEYDYESSSRKIIKGNIYLAKVVRIEPSLQAAFVEYGQERHGFLPFSDIHPDYYRLPDNEPAKDANVTTEEPSPKKASTVSEDLQAPAVEHAVEGDAPIATEEDAENISSFRRERMYRHHKIQEVIKKGQVILVQVAREQRGEKGAALTTYLTLAGRYCVLMPNAGRAGGVSRKINDNGDRQRLKRILDGIDVPEGMGLIIRTAGMDRTKIEIKKDLDYLQRIWQKIRDLTLASTAPQLIHTEGNILQRAIRDLYTKDIDDITVEGDEAFQITRSYMKILMPTHVKKVKAYEDTAVPMFQHHHVEEQLSAIQDTKVQLKSGGYLVIDTTEALVAIDVNSGRSTKERHIDDTALRTNLEAAEEVARQLRLRDLAGLIVIDFIDMDTEEHNTQVEKQLKDCLQEDRARIQVGTISSFGLLEMSRQRLRPSLFESTMTLCDHCNGTGHVRDSLSLALQAFRVLESNIINAKAEDQFTLILPVASAFVLFNHKRRQLTQLEDTYKVSIDIRLDEKLIGDEFKLTQNDKEIKSFYRPSKRQAPKPYPTAIKAHEKPKLQPIEMYDLQDEALIESYAPTTETAPEGERRHNNNHNRNRRFNDRRNNHRNRKFNDRRNENQAAPSSTQEKKPWWKRLLQGS
jgi:ribonuclease E